MNSDSVTDGHNPENDTTTLTRPVPVGVGPVTSPFKDDIGPKPTVTDVGKNDIAILQASGDVHMKPATYGQADCQCMHCKTNRVNGTKLNIIHDRSPNKTSQDVQRVSLPGDVDYDGVCKQRVL